MKFHSLIAAALLCAASSSHAALIHEFKLDGSLNDSVTGTALTALGGSVVQNRYVFGANQGLKLDAQLGGVYTIDMAFHFDRFGNYGRIVNFTNLSGDNGLYVQGHAFRLFGASGASGSGGYLTENIDSRVTLTRDANQMFKVYQNGELVLSVADAGGIADFGRNVAYFFRDNNGAHSGEANPGAVDYLRIYDTALSQQEVQALTPPATAISEPATFGLLGAGLALMGWTRRQGKPKGTPLPRYGVFPWPALSWLD
ncbi:hypothetical protein IM543_02660 [Massilia sp. UMI-21]|nr:hypothetical protein IM543_02660 [Massilia sp. UMI-21]